MTGNPSYIHAALAANACHQASMIALVPVLLSLFGVDLQVIGFLVGAGLAMSAIAVPIWGWAVTALGMTGSVKVILWIAVGSVLILGLSLLALQWGLVTAGIGFVIFVAARILYCLTAPAILPLAHASWAEVSQQNARILGAVGRTNAVNGFGRVIGNLSVAPMLALGLGPVGVILLTVPFYLLTLMKLTGLKTVPKRENVRSQGVSSMAVTAIARSMVAALVQMGVGTAYILLGPIIQRGMGVGAEEAAGLTGICLAISLIAGILSHLGLKPFFAKRQLVGLLMMGLAGGFALIWLGQAGGFTIIVFCTALLAASVAALLSLNTASALQEVSADRAAAVATSLSSAQFIGLAIGTALGGSLGEISLEAACYTAGGLVAGSGLLQIFISLKRGFHNEALPANPPLDLKRSPAK